MHPFDKAELRSALDAVQRSRWREYPPEDGITVEWLRRRYQVAVEIGLIPRRWIDTYGRRAIDDELRSWAEVVGAGFGATFADDRARAWVCE